MVAILKPTHKGKSSGSAGIHPHNTDINTAGANAAFTLTAFPPFSTRQPASTSSVPLGAEYLVDPARTTAILVLVQPWHRQKSLLTEGMKIVFFFSFPSFFLLL